MKYRGKDIKTYLRHECIIPTEFTKKEMIDNVVDRYSIARKNLEGYKAMYHKGTTTIYGEEANIFFPVLVNVEIPKNSLIYTDPEEAKCRATKGKIKKILDSDLMISRHARIMVTIGRISRRRPEPYRRCFIRAQIIEQHDDDYYSLYIEPEWMEVLSVSFGRPIHDGLPQFYKVRGVRNDIVYSMFETQKMYDLVCTYSIYERNWWTLEDLERHEGDVIDESDNFDMRPLACSSGFHFFKEPLEAVDYVSILF